MQLVVIDLVSVLNVMQKNQSNQETLGNDSNVFVQDFRAKPLTYIVQIIVVLLFVANLWIFAQLAPVLKDLALITQRVEAAEIAIVPKGEIQVQFADVKEDLARMEDKLDRLIDRELQSKAASKPQVAASSSPPQSQPAQSNQSVTVNNPQPAPTPQPTPKPTSILDILPIPIIGL